MDVLTAQGADPTQLRSAMAALWAGLSVLQRVAVALGLVTLLIVALRSRRRRSRRARPSPRPGEIWFAEVPFADGTGSKDRPVLVLELRGRTCTVARVTSQDQDARRDYLRAPEGIPGLARASWLHRDPLDLPVSHFRRRAGDPGEALVEWFRDRTG